MKEPETLAAQLHVLVTMDDRTYVITRKQAEQIVLMKQKNVPSTLIGDNFLMLHQVCDMPTLETYRIQMKTKLAEKHQRMCKRCGMIVPIADRCPCRENRSPSLYETATKQNPTLLKFLEDSGLTQLALPAPEPVLLPEAPPTPKEREQIRVIQGYKDRFLGRATIKLPDCATCNNERQYLFQGVMVKCDCTITGKIGSAKPFTQAEQSGTIPSPSPLAS